MSLITVQKALARIYTDSKLRDDFLTNPEVVGRTLKLNCWEIQQLSQLSSQEVNLFASSLKYKRLGEIRKLLPLTTKVLGNELNNLFFKYAETYLPRGNKKHLQDTIQFAQFILQTTTKETIQPAWILDILRHEKMWLETLTEEKLMIANRFDYPIHILIHNLQTADFTPKLEPQTTITIWFRLSPQHKWHSLTIPVQNFTSLVQPIKQKTMTILSKMLVSLRGNNRSKIVKS